MNYKIKINCDNAAFAEDEAPEIARILEDLAFKLRSDWGTSEIKLRDINGNIVGSAKMIDYE